MHQSHDLHVPSSQPVLVVLDEIAVFPPEAADVDTLTKMGKSMAKFNLSFLLLL